MFECTCGYKTEIERNIYKCEICDYILCDRCEYNCQICSADLCMDHIIIQGEKDEWDYLCESCDIEQHKPISTVQNDEGFN